MPMMMSYYSRTTGKYSGCNGKTGYGMAVFDRVKEKGKELRKLEHETHTSTRLLGYGMKPQEAAI